MRKMSAQNAVARRDDAPKTRCHGSPSADSGARMVRLDFIDLSDASAPLEAVPQEQVIEMGCLACTRTDGKLLTNGSVFVHQACLGVARDLFLQPLETLAEMHFPSAAQMLREACAYLTVTDIGLLIDAACAEYAFGLSAGTSVPLEPFFGAEIATVTVTDTSLGDD